VELTVARYRKVESIQRVDGRIAARASAIGLAGNLEAVMSADDEADDNRDPLLLSSVWRIRGKDFELGVCTLLRRIFVGLLREFFRKDAVLVDLNLGCRAGKSCHHSFWLLRKQKLSTALSYQSCG